MPVNATGIQRAIQATGRFGCAGEGDTIKLIGGGAPSWNILCDFDGTISVEDVTDVLLERFGQPGWHALEAEWQAGRMSSRQCMQGQIALLDADKDELDAQIDQFRIDPDFPAFVACARQLGLSLTIASDGLDYAIRRILAVHGLGDIEIRANHLVRRGARGWRLESPCADASCRVDSGTCKCAMRFHQSPRGHVLLIGDGASDFCAAEQADFVFAKHRLIEYCRRQQLRHVPIVGFADAVRLLPALVEARHEATGSHQPNLDTDNNA